MSTGIQVSELICRAQVAPFGSSMRQGASGLRLASVKRSRNRIDIAAMLPPNRPSNPLDELAGRRAWSGPTLANGVLTDELVAFCQSGLSVVLAGRDESGRPVVGRALSCRIDGVGKVRLVVRRDSNEDVLRAIAGGGGLAATFTKPSTHRSIQLKGASAWIREADASDQRLAADQTRALQAELVDDGFETGLAAQYCAFEADALVAVEFVPLQAFVQTPGPGAGTALTA
jgi:hypothetical protein